MTTESRILAATLLLDRQSQRPLDGLGVSTSCVTEGQQPLHNGLTSSHGHMANVSAGGMPDLLAGVDGPPSILLGLSEINFKVLRQGEAQDI